jgi:hypothetical protein
VSIIVIGAAGVTARVVATAACIVVVVTATTCGARIDISAGSSVAVVSGGVIAASDGVAIAV